MRSARDFKGMAMTTSDAAASGFRLMHVMVRVGDLERSIDFYCRHFGMKVLRREDVPEGKYTNVFVGYGSEFTDPIVELTYNYGVESYERGTGFGHLAIGVHDIKGVCERLRASGVNIVREPGPVKFGTLHIAFVDDPDGYRIELIDVDTGAYGEARRSRQ
jgi:lactoylglutathione lyase